MDGECCPNPKLRLTEPNVFSEPRKCNERQQVQQKDNAERAGCFLRFSADERRHRTNSGATTNSGPAGNEGAIDMRFYTSCEVQDAIRGLIKFDYTDVDDTVLIKTDGFPSYHLASVVDDHAM